LGRSVDLDQREDKEATRISLFQRRRTMQKATKNIIKKVSENSGRNMTFTTK